MLEQHEKLMERYEKLIDSGTDEELINLLYSADPLPKMPRTLFGLIFFCIFFIAWLDDAYNTKFIDTLAEIAYRWLEPHN